MNIDLYRSFFEIQKKHWWFVAKKEIIFDVIKKYINNDGKIKILDVGCGSGLMLSDLEEVGETYGMDMSEDAIRFSREIFSGSVKQGALPDNIPYPNSMFDLIIALDVIEHVEQDLEALIALGSKMNESGKAIITVPAYMFMWTNFDVRNEHKRRYTSTEMRFKIEKAGFTIEKITYINTLLFPLAFISRMLNKIKKEADVSGLNVPINPINFLLKLIFSFEKYLIRFINLPFGLSVLVVAVKK